MSMFEFNTCTYPKVVGIYIIPKKYFKKMLHTQFENKELKKVIAKQPVKAIHKGIEARCGATNCNHKLGEFESASGMIKCTKCGALNVVKK